MLRTVVASAVVASAAAFSAPSAFTGMGLNTQVIMQAGKRRAAGAFALEAPLFSANHTLRDCNTVRTSGTEKEDGGAVAAILVADKRWPCDQSVSSEHN